MAQQQSQANVGSTSQQSQQLTGAQLVGMSIPEASGAARVPSFGNTSALLQQIATSPRSGTNINTTPQQQQQQQQPLPQQELHQQPNLQQQVQEMQRQLQELQQQIQQQQQQSQLQEQSITQQTSVESLRAGLGEEAEEEQQQQQQQLVQQQQYQFLAEQISRDLSTTGAQLELQELEHQRELERLQKQLQHLQQKQKEQLQQQLQQMQQQLQEFHQQHQQQLQQLQLQLQQQQQFSMPSFQAGGLLQVSNTSATSASASQSLLPRMQSGLSAGHQQSTNRAFQNLTNQRFNMAANLASAMTMQPQQQLGGQGGFSSINQSANAQNLQSGFNVRATNNGNTVTIQPQQQLGAQDGFISSNQPVNAQNPQSGFKIGATDIASVMSMQPQQQLGGQVGFSVINRSTYPQTQQFGTPFLGPSESQDRHCMQPLRQLGAQGGFHSSQLVNARNLLPGLSIGTTDLISSMAMKMQQQQQQQRQRQQQQQLGALGGRGSSVIGECATISSSSSSYSDTESHFPTTSVKHNVDS